MSKERTFPGDCRDGRDFREEVALGMSSRSREGGMKASQLQAGRLVLPATGREGDEEGLGDRSQLPAASVTLGLGLLPFAYKMGHRNNAPRCRAWWYPNHRPPPGLSQEAGCANGRFHGSDPTSAISSDT